MTTAGRLATVLFVVFVMLALPQPAIAAPPIVVGDGTPASCTESALQSAVALAGNRGGGTVSFRCGPDPVTIVLTAPLTVPNNTTINGGGLITLSGPVIGHLIVIEQESTVALRNLTITNVAGPAPYYPDGFGVLNEGSLTVSNGNLSGSGGGAISNQGTLTVRDSVISHNGRFGTSCVGINNHGTLTLSGSTLEGNWGYFYGAICNEGSATINNSRFIGNQSDDWGGGIFNQGTLTIKKSGFFANGASSYGGGIFHWAGTLTVTDSTFEGNGALFGGGAIIGEGSITNSLFSGNGCSQGGIGGAVEGPFVIKKSVFTGNSCGNGGAFFGGGTIDDSSFSHNSAFQGGAIRTLGPLTIRDSTITENTASDAGGGIYVSLIGGFPILINTTITANTPDDIHTYP
jgi:predicted outer membrane repeat protein